MTDNMLVILACYYVVVRWDGLQGYGDIVDINPTLGDTTSLFETDVDARERDMWIPEICTDEFRVPTDQTTEHLPSLNTFTDECSCCWFVRVH